MPLLTEEQQRRLDEAAAAAALSRSHEEEPTFFLSSSPNGGKAKTKHGKTKATGKSQNWGTVFDSTKPPIVVLDKNDPNYDPVEGGFALRAPVTDSVVAYKDEVTRILTAFFGAGGQAEALARLAELAQPVKAHHFVRKGAPRVGDASFACDSRPSEPLPAVTLALDKTQREKEATAQLLSAAFPALINARAMSRGFASLLDACEDTQLDVPDAPHQLSLFLARAVSDDICPPSFLSSSLAARPGGGARAALAAASALLHSPAAGAQIAGAWVGGDGSDGGTLASAKAAVARTLAELWRSGETSDALAALVDLRLPFFMHEPVCRCLVAALEDPSREARALALLSAGAASGAFSRDQLAAGMGRAARLVDDVALDAPRARAAWPPLAAKAAALLRAQPAAAAAAGGDAGGGSAADAGGGGGGDGEAAFKAAATSVLMDYYASGDVADAVASVEALMGPPHSQHTEPPAAASSSTRGAILVKRVVATACDRGPRGCEAAARLLAVLLPSPLSRSDLEAGFDLLLSSADDLVLDVPAFPELLLRFILRSIVDGGASPAWLAAARAKAVAASDAASAPAPPPPTQHHAGAASEPDGVAHRGGGGVGSEVLRAAAAALRSPGIAERATHAWGGAPGHELASAKAAISALLDEYLVGATAAGEAGVALRALRLPFFAHEAVKSACVAAMERGGPSMGRVGDLLTSWARDGTVSATQLAEGKARAAARVDDLVLDVGPCARVRWAELLGGGLATAEAAAS